MYRSLKKTITYVILIYFLIGTIFLSISLFFRVKADEIKQAEIVSSEELLMDVEKTIVSNKVNRLTTDVLYVADTLRLGDISSGNYSGIEKLLLAFSDRKKIYDQIRYIDLDGNEVIRINYSEKGSYATSDQDLQNKKERYYFTDTINLKKNQIFISKLDLNIEHDEIEQPIKPMIRLSTPFYGSDGELHGIVVLNYYANDMLQQVKKIASTSRGYVFLLNSNSYWLYNGENSSKEWAFMYDDKLKENFSNEYPKEWNAITKVNEGSLITSNGLFSFSNILTSNEFWMDNMNNSVVLDEGDWYIVSLIGSSNPNGILIFENIPQKIVAILKTDIWVFLILLGISFILAVLVTLNKNKKDRIKYFSEYDTMTGVYNRRAGFEKLSRIYKDATKDSGKISICFIDINGLKDVNDYLGHEAGDELILSIVNGIKGEIRDKDFVCRLGGDEFLIVFNHLDESGAEEIWLRINEGYMEINETGGRKYIISASHGIEEFKFRSDEYIDTIINHADEKMYQEKRIIKKDLKVVR
ncbi:sensor domain-containing diguanylate cyclase [Anaerotignum sp.]|uniref:sensor domain-containing diguanylate cyclase n=1 Tax=Anaerotignum sp. TaxID=2039241 RepID=UPI00271498EF|nr:diguanylate cyclase [Anaerotignum sp.]